jgi:hypothetical protein
LIQHRGFLGGETIFWAAQGNTIIGNPPHATCYFLLPGFFLSIYYYLKQKHPLSFITACLLASPLVGFKVSAAAVVIAGIFIAALIYFISTKKKDLLLLAFIVFTANFLTFKLITKNGESLLLFLPWWFIRTMIVVPDRLNWVDLELKRQFYLDRGGFRATLRIIEYEALAFFIYLLGNLGTRLIGFVKIIQEVKSKQFFQPLNLALIITMLTGFITTLFFVQKGVTYNFIQFMQYFLLIFGFFAAATMAKVKKLWLIIPFILLSLPTVIGNLIEFYYQRPALAVVSHQELTALKTLKSLTNDQDIIFTPLHNRYAKNAYSHQPWPISVWDSTSYISAYTGRQTYLNDEGQMTILGLNIEPRQQKIKKFFEDQEPLENKIAFLNQEKITYLYVRPVEIEKKAQETLNKLHLDKVFENQEVVIYHHPL